VCVYLHCTRHVMRGSLKILYPVMWQLLRPFFLFEFVNWNSGNVFLCTFFFYAAWSVFFAIAPLPILQSHCDKIAITRMFVYATGFFAIAAHQRFATTLSRMFAITCIFTKLQPHQTKTNVVAILTVSWHWAFFELVYCNRTFLPVFAIAITLRQDLQSTTFWFATIFFLQSQHISRCKYTAKDAAITCILTRLQPHQAKTTLAAILQCHGMELFFWTGVFLPVFFATVFFLQNHCSKGAITLPQGCNHSHAWFLATTFFCNRSTSAVATTL
jgi:hypothetical protein